MAYFVWANDMVIDNGLIDEEHKHLIGLVNQLHDATSQGKGQDVVGEILEALIAYSALHLSREEDIMAQACFPNLERHKLGHQAFVSSLRGLQALYQKGNVTVAAQLSTILRDWISLHIRRNDKELVGFLATGGRRNLEASPHLIRSGK